MLASAIIFALLAQQPSESLVTVHVSPVWVTCPQQQSLANAMATAVVIEPNATFDEPIVNGTFASATRVGRSFIHAKRLLKKAVA